MGAENERSRLNEIWDNDAISAIKNYKRSVRQKKKKKTVKVGGSSIPSLSLSLLG